ncbi:PKD domain-containing protein, partial [Maribacter sp. CXY002]|uniref:T9SS type A sorting domain-containing protein n=1 Tax=Maribacter luteocoastalis TaxID=3407671 RepID=UPI003B6858ED
PRYLRLVRQGDTFSAYGSLTNGNWELLGSRVVAMPTTVYVGLAVTSHNDGVVATATFDDVVVQGLAPSGNEPPVAVAGGTPLGGSSPLDVSFTGSGSTDDTGVTGYSWDFGDGSPLSTEADPLHTYVTDGTYTAVLTVTDAEGLTATATLTIGVVAVQDCTALSPPWQGQDIGAVSVGGSSCQDQGTGTYEIRASGSDIWGRADEFHYVYQQLSGDMEITARVLSLDNTNGWAKAGLMIRSGLSANASLALVSMHPNPLGSGPGYTLQQRDTDGGAMSSSTAHNIGPVSGGFPRYLRLVRQGDTFSAYGSLTNGNWELLGSRVVAMPTTVYVGLAVTSHNDGVVATATFDDVVVNTLVTALQVRLPQELANLEINAEPIIYPNPTTDVIKISNLSSLKKEVLILIFDSSGRMLQEKKFQISYQEIEINVSHLPDGNYFLKLIGEGNSFDYQFGIKH